MQLKYFQSRWNLTFLKCNLRSISSFIVIREVIKHKKNIVYYSHRFILCVIIKCETMSFYFYFDVESVNTIHVSHTRIVEFYVFTHAAYAVESYCMYTGDYPIYPIGYRTHSHELGRLSVLIHTNTRRSSEI